MPTYRCEPGATIGGNDQQGNVWAKPLVFDKDGLLHVSQDEQDVYAVLEAAVGNGVITRVEKPPKPSPNRKES